MESVLIGTLRYLVGDLDRRIDRYRTLTSHLVTRKYLILPPILYGHRGEPAGLDDCLPPLQQVADEALQYPQRGRVTEETKQYYKRYKAIHSSTQRYTAVRSGTQRYTTVHRSTQQYTAVHSGTQRYTAVHSGTQRYTAVHNGTQRYTAVHNGTQRYTAEHSGTQQNTVVHSGSKQY
eukprot:1188335-Prorocentrum_minimum.AAC.1